MCKAFYLAVACTMLTGCTLMEWAADQGFGWHPRDPKARFQCEMDPLKPGCAYYDRQYREDLLKWRQPPLSDTES